MWDERKRDERTMDEKKTEKIKSVPNPFHLIFFHAPNDIGIDIWQLPLYFAKIGGNMEATLDKFGRIVIPKEIRDDFNLKPGNRFHIEESENAIILKPISGEANLRWKEGVLVFSGEPLADLSKAVEKHREERIKGHGS